MFEAFIKALISIGLLVICVYLGLWFVAGLGLGIPGVVINIVWMIVVLICVLIIYRLFKPWISGWFPQ